MEVKMDRKLLDLIIEVRFKKLMSELDVKVLTKLQRELYGDFYAYGFRECLGWLKGRGLDVNLTEEEK